VTCPVLKHKSSPPNSNPSTIITPAFVAKELCLAKVDHAAVSQRVQRLPQSTSCHDLLPPCPSHASLDPTSGLLVPPRKSPLNPTLPLLLNSRLLTRSIQLNRHPRIVRALVVPSRVPTTTSGSTVIILRGRTRWSTITIAIPVAVRVVITHLSISICIVRVLVLIEVLMQLLMRRRDRCEVDIVVVLIVLLLLLAHLHLMQVVKTTVQTTRIRALPVRVLVAPTRHVVIGVVLGVCGDGRVDLVVVAVVLVVVGVGEVAHAGGRCVLDLVGVLLQGLGL
jgi:hypothetical protein